MKLARKHLSTRLLLTVTIQKRPEINSNQAEGTSSWSTRPHHNG